MTWQTLLVQNAATLKLKQQQLVCQGRDTGQEITLPLEDLNALILESPEIVITNALLAALQDNQVAVITCDNKHMPNGVMLAFHPHSRQAQVSHLQLSWSEPFKKRCWQRIVQQKIHNQAHCLELLRRSEPELVEALVNQVNSGDPENREAQAAKLYWPRLFGSSFQRKNEALLQTAALNYGYAIVRSCVARAIVAAGLLPCFGLHHQSQLNAFNLADDLIEPLRPMVDLLVANHPVFQSSDAENSEHISISELTILHRRTLARLPGLSCVVEGETITLVNAVERIVTSLLHASREKDVRGLLLPGLVSPKHWDV